MLHNTLKQKCKARMCKQDTGRTAELEQQLKGWLKDKTSKVECLHSEYARLQTRTWRLSCSQRNWRSRQWICTSLISPLKLNSKHWIGVHPSSLLTMDYWSVDLSPRLNRKVLSRALGIWTPPQQLCGTKHKLSEGNPLSLVQLQNHISGVSSKFSGEMPPPQLSIHHKDALSLSITWVSTNATTGETAAQFAKRIAPPPQDNKLSIMLDSVQ